jgi:MFS family permease
MVMCGGLTGWLSWRLGFLINVSLGIALMVGAWRWIAESERRSGSFDVIAYQYKRLRSTQMSSLINGVTAHLTGVLATAIFVFVTVSARVILPFFVFIPAEKVTL